MKTQRECHDGYEIVFILRTTEGDSPEEGVILIHTDQGLT